MRSMLLAASMILGISCVVMMPDVAWSQAATSGIAGVVKDASGAVVPGVSVEASSPALIEKVRSVVTDGEGQYKIIDLRPGVYSVVFTLPGFTTYKREGLELPPGFTAAVNAEMRIGSVEESVTVSGVSPVVDIATNKDSKVLSQSVLEGLPSTQRNPNNYTPLIPGVSGNLGQVGVFGGTFTIHGSAISSTRLAIDGFETNSMAADGAGFIYYVNMASVQESSVSISGESAEVQLSGVRNNIVPKTGGNKFSGFFFAGGGGHKLQADNLTPELIGAGLTAVNSLKELYDINPAWGGPIIKDKLWFYNAYRYNTETDYLAGLYFNATPSAWTYTPDLTRQAGTTVWDISANLRATWQAAKDHRVSLFFDSAPHCTCNRGFSSTVSPEATQIGIFWPNYFGQATWRYTATNRLLMEAGVASSWGSFQYNRQPGVDVNTIAVTEQSTGFSYRANSAYGQNPTNPLTMRFAVTYVTGSHAAKFGISDIVGHNVATNETAFARTYRFNNGVPNQVTLQATPSVVVTNLDADLGLYAQDRWTMKRLTLNYGLRFDYFHGSVPVQDEGALLAKYGLSTPLFVPVLTYDAVDNVPNWKDLNPRLGAVYDLFGDGKTALKLSVGRYVAGQTVGIATANNPITRSVTSATRTWNDNFFPVGDPRRGNFVVDCDFNNPAANEECDRLSNLNFGKANPLATTYADDVTRGYGQRSYNWELTTGVQRELWPGASVTANYYRRSFGNFMVTQNLSTSPSDYTSYCINAPVDTRLPGGGGNRICGFYDVNQNKFGQQTSLITQAANFGTQESVWDGYGVTTSIRVPRSGVIQGGVDQGRQRTNNCYALNQPNLSGLAGQPNIQASCDVRPPWQPQIKFLVSYPVPFGVQVGVGYQNLPGPQITASYSASSTEIQPSLGRPLSSGAAGTATLQIIPPGTLYGARAQELDLSFRKAFTAGRSRLIATADIFNVLNRSDVLTYNNTFGPQFLRPTSILSARWLKFGMQVDF